jgi:small-conductance mechanosensitive channel
MAENISSSVASDVTSILSGFELVIERFVRGIEARAAALAGAGSEIDVLHASFAAGGTSAGALAFQILVVALVTAGVLLACRRWFASEGAGAWRRLFATLAAAFIAIVAGVVVQRLLPAEGLAVRSLRIWIVVTAGALVAIFAIRALVTHSKPVKVGRSAALARDLSIAVGWSMFGLAIMGTLRLWGLGPGLRDLLGSILLAAIAFGLFGWTVWRHRRTLAASVAGSKPRSRWQGRLARLWPTMVIGFLAVTFVSTEVALTVGVPLPGATVLLSIIIVFLTPHLDALIASSANKAMESTRASILGVALRQTARFAVLIVMVTMLGAVWASPLASGFGINLQSVAVESVHIALIALAAAFLWSVLGAVMGRILQGDKHALADPMTPRSRLGTLVPLISAIGKATILALAFLSVLVSVGVNVWPLITGLSVFGLAIGFGSQTLVKDIVSGLFFLVDDAFRLGEYIETSGAKGTVE